MKGALCVKRNQRARIQLKFIWRFVLFHHKGLRRWPVRLAVRTLAFHAGNTGSNPVRVTSDGLAFASPFGFGSKEVLMTESLRFGCHAAEVDALQLHEGTQLGFSLSSCGSGCWNERESG